MLPPKALSESQAFFIFLDVDNTSSQQHIKRTSLNMDAKKTTASKSGANVGVFLHLDFENL